MSYHRILKGLAGLGAHKLGGRLESFFGGLGEAKVPVSMCACTKWRKPWRKPTISREGVHSVHWGKTCRGPGDLRFVIRITEPGMQYGKTGTTRHAAEAEIDVYKAPGRGAEVSPGWRRRQSKRLGYFKSVDAAKKASNQAVGQWCRKVQGR